MSQMKNLSWTSTGADKQLDVGFTVNQITVTNSTAGGQFYWNSSMLSGSFIRVDTGAYTSTTGFTPLAQSAVFGATVSGFTDATPGVITATGIAQVGIVAGDTIKVAEIADSGTGTSSLNGTYTVASVTATTITLVEATTGFATYVSGGKVTRVKDSSNVPIATENFAIIGMTLGSGVRGSNNDVLTAVVLGSNSVT